MDQDPIAKTQRWLEEVIVGQNFCPFAKPYFVKGEVAIVLASAGIEALLEDLVSQGEQVVLQESSKTALVVTDEEELNSDFSTYFSLFQLAESMLFKHFKGELTLASFHPLHQFAEVDVHAPSQWIHQSPFATFHILHTEMIENLGLSKNRIQAILQENEAKARSLGKGYFASFLHS